LPCLQGPDEAASPEVSVTAPSSTDPPGHRDDAVPRARGLRNGTGSSCLSSVPPHHLFRTLWRGVKEESQHLIFSCCHYNTLLLCCKQNSPNPAVSAFDNATQLRSFFYTTIQAINTPGKMLEATSLLELPKFLGAHSAF